MPVVSTNKKLQKKKCTSHSDSGANVIIKGEYTFFNTNKKMYTCITYIYGVKVKANLKSVLCANKTNWHKII